MKYLLFLLLLPVMAAGQSAPADSLLKARLREAGGGVAVVPAQRWKAGAPLSGCPTYILPRKGLEAALRGAKTGRDSMNLIDSSFCLRWPDTTSLWLLPIDPAKMDSLRLRRPGAGDSCAASGRRSGCPGLEIAVADTIPALFLAAGTGSRMIVMQAAGTAPIQPQAAVQQAAADCACDPGRVGAGWILVFIPVIFLAILLGMFGRKLRNINLDEVLSENISSKDIILNPEYKADHLARWMAMANNGQAANPAALEAARKDAEKAKADLAAAQVVVQTREDEVKRTRLLAADPAATDAQKQAYQVANAALDAAQQQVTEKEAAARQADGKVAAFNAGTLSPAMLVNLSMLFPPTIVVSKDPGIYRPSSSRLIALLTGLLLIAVVLGLSCFYIYYYLCAGKPADLSHLSTILIALGIGIAPYAFNKIAGALGGPKKDL